MKWSIIRVGIMTLFMGLVTSVLGMTVGKTCHSGQISGIMVGVQIIEIGPRMYHVAFL